MMRSRFVSLLLALAISACADPPAVALDGAPPPGSDGAAALDAAVVGSTTIRFLHLNDLHAHLVPHADLVTTPEEGAPHVEMRGGIARLASLIERERGGAPHSVLMKVSETYRTTVHIEAAPEVVFDHFVRPELLVRWMGDFAKLDAKGGGLFAVDINGVIIRGHFVRVERSTLVEIAWGEAGNEAMPPGSMRLVVRFRPFGAGTLVEFEHGGLDAGEAKKHALGWPHFIARLAVLAGGGDPGPDPWATSPPT